MITLIKMQITQIVYRRDNLCNRIFPINRDPDIVGKKSV